MSEIYQPVLDHGCGLRPTMVQAPHSERQPLLSSRHRNWLTTILLSFYPLVFIAQSVAFEVFLCRLFLPRYLK